ncbi:MAG TPA: 50S ribosomal protein L25 [Kofleriaceae bacterium]|nr:50S ribosomal protein L25 [Kofleriaceae bacterium]
MEVGKLTVTRRTDIGKGESRRLRKTGMVPGVCYGSGLETPLPVLLNPKELAASLDPVKRQNTVIEVTVNGETGGNATLMALLWDYQSHPIKREVTHVDLLAIDPEKAVEVEVPIELTGKAAGLVDGGQLHMVRHDLAVRCRPADIPGKILVDVTAMHIGDAIHVSDLTLPAGVEATLSERLTVVTCSAPEADVAPAAEGGEAAAAAPASTDAKSEKKEEGK